MTLTQIAQQYLEQMRANPLSQNEALAALYLNAMMLADHTRYPAQPDIQIRADIAKLLLSITLYLNLNQKPEDCLLEHVNKALATKNLPPLKEFRAAHHHLEQLREHLRLAHFNKTDHYTALSILLDKLELSL